MKNNHVCAAVTLAAFTLVGGAFAQSSSSAGGAQGDASKQMHEKMMGSMQKMQSMPMSGDMDKDFAMMMRQHHLSGIEMAQKELDSGKNPEMKRMAKKIIESQKKEVGEFDKWLSRHK
jgi:uncharacterized protein (DUF305 family)